MNHRREGKEGWRDRCREGRASGTTRHIVCVHLKSSAMSEGQEHPGDEYAPYRETDAMAESKRKRRTRCHSSHEQKEKRICHGRLCLFTYSKSTFGERQSSRGVKAASERRPAG